MDFLNFDIYYFRLILKESLPFSHFQKNTIDVSFVHNKEKI